MPQLAVAASRDRHSRSAVKEVEWRGCSSKSKIEWEAFLVPEPRQLKKGRLVPRKFNQIYAEASDFFWCPLAASSQLPRAPSHGTDATWVVLALLGRTCRQEFDGKRGQKRRASGLSGAGRTRAPTQDHHPPPQPHHAKPDAVFVARGERDVLAVLVTVGRNHRK
jgi:hypothetical protein